MESLSRSDQLVLAVVAGVVGLLVLISLRSTRPGAPARVGAILAGLMLLLTMIVGLHAHEVTNPRSHQTSGTSDVHNSAGKAG